MSCPACSRPVPHGSKYCPSCGQATAEAPAAEPTTFTISASHGAPDSDGLTHGRFLPGQLIGDRYRVVSLLGRGGMGEVYRADDLHLGQSVALKFIPERVATDSAALERFKQEVRTARQVTHPNVCRIHDFDQVANRTFLSMEYVDGEDLSHVVKRLGRPTQEKALEITRQLCLGLAAAHEAGVIHRDLKPANIMIDGRGKVRIMDFGIAGLEAELIGEQRLTGTPAYMAPELFQGTSASVCSDVYALGLVLYELFTGRKAYEGQELSRLQALHETATPTPPSSLVFDVDPVVEQVILRCLEKDPVRRPASAYAVLSALPGGDPLAAMVVAGQTPSPELVASAGEVGGLRPWVAGMCAAGILISSLVMAWLWQPRLAGLQDSPERLQLKAEQLLAELGYDELPRHSATGFSKRPELLASLRQGNRTPTTEEVANAGALFYWARWSEDPLTPGSIHTAYPLMDDPPQALPGSITVFLGLDARLLALSVVPKEHPPMPTAIDTPPNWDVLLKAAGVDRSLLTAEDDSPIPHTFGEVTSAWRGAPRLGSEHPLHYQAGSVAGRAVYFSVVDEAGSSALANSRGSNPYSQDLPLYLIRFYAVTTVVPLLAGILLAWRNLRLGRGDKRGAAALAGVTLLAYWLQSAFAVNLAEEGLAYVALNLLAERALGHALIHALSNGLFYLALEPYARRIWPWLLVSWARITSGRLRDPLVGRDVLFGTVTGFAAALAIELGFRLGALTGWHPSSVTPEPLELDTLSSMSSMARGIAHSAAASSIDTLAVLVYALLAQFLFRRFWAAILVAFAVAVVDRALGVLPLFGAYGAPVVALVMTTAMVLSLFRFGLLTALTAGFVFRVLFHVPGTLDLSVWYADRMLLGFAVLFGLTGYGLFTSLAGRSLFRDVLDEIPPAVN